MGLVSVAIGERPEEAITPHHARHARPDRLYGELTRIGTPWGPGTHVVGDALSYLQADDEGSRFGPA